MFSILIPLCSICVNTIFPLTKKIFLICISALKKAVELPYGMIHLYIGVLAFLDKDGHCFFEQTNILRTNSYFEKKVWFRKKTKDGRTDWVIQKKKRNRWKMNHHFENKGKNFYEGSEKTKDQCENEGKWKHRNQNPKWSYPKHVCIKMAEK